MLFGGWIIVGLLAALNLLLLVSFFWGLIVTVPLTIGLASLLERRNGAEATKWGVAIGGSALPLYFAWFNRHGPGTYCHSIGTPQYPGTECGEQWDPRPFLVVGIALLLLPVIGPLWSRRRRNRDSTATH